MTEIDLKCPYKEGGRPKNAVFVPDVGCTYILRSKRAFLLPLIFPTEVISLKLNGPPY
jgi:hypothetical protein